MSEVNVRQIQKVVVPLFAIRRTFVLFDSSVRRKENVSKGLCEVSVVVFRQTTTFKECKVAVLGSKWVPCSSKELGEEIIRRGLALNKGQAKAVTEAIKFDEGIDMLREYFYFTKTDDPEEPIEVDSESWGSPRSKNGNARELCFLLRNFP